MIDDKWARKQYKIFVDYHSIPPKVRFEFSQDTEFDEHFCEKVAILFPILYTPDFDLQLFKVFALLQVICDGR